MRYILTLIGFLFFFSNAYSQSNDTIKVTGLVKSDMIITKSYLQSMRSFDLNDVNTSCNPKQETIVKSVRVVLLKDVLEKVAYKYVRSKELNEFYFMFEGADGYKAVFSFNEIYNTEVGNYLYLITEMDGKTQYENSIMMLSLKDIKGGSRNIKNLVKIIVKNAD